MRFNEQQAALKTANEIYDLVNKLYDRQSKKIYDDNSQRIKHNKFEMHLFERIDDLTDFYKEITHLIRLETRKIASEPIDYDDENNDEEGVK